MKEPHSVLIELLNRVTVVIEKLQELDESQMPPVIYSGYFRAATDLEREIGLAIQELGQGEFNKEDLPGICQQVERLEADFEQTLA